MHFYALPTELLQEIFGWIHPLTAVRYKRLSRFINSIIENDGFALINAKRYWLHLDPDYGMLFKLPEAHQHVYAALISKHCKKLDISNLDLNQPIPKAFLNPTLTALEGFNAGVVGQLPPELWMMESLQLLSLGANCDSYGVIPTTVANLSDLRVLDLSYCNLMESCIPSEIGNLRNICQLSLHDCNLAGAIPDSFNLLTDLREVNLSNNKLTGSIHFLQSFKHIYHMHLSRNLLSGAIPAGIRNCVGLISFTVDFNRLEGKIPPEIFELSCLIELLLDHNQLTGEIPENAGEKTPNLLKFRCNNNRLTGPLPTFKHSLKLKYLNLSENEFLC